MRPRSVISFSAREPGTERRVRDPTHAGHARPPWTTLFAGGSPNAPVADSGARPNGARIPWMRRQRPPGGPGLRFMGGPSSELGRSDRAPGRTPSQLWAIASSPLQWREVRRRTDKSDRPDRRTIEVRCGDRSRAGREERCLHAPNARSTPVGIALIVPQGSCVSRVGRSSSESLRVRLKRCTPRG